MTSAQRPATPAEVKALSHPLRLRILALCNAEALTNKELAGRLHEQPATVLHHVRTLVRTGFLAAEEERPGPRGSTLRPYRATDKSWTIDIGGPSRSGSTKLAAVDAAVTDMHMQPADALGPLTLYTLRATREQLEKVMDVLVSELDLVDAQTADGTEPVWNLLIASYHSSE